MDKESEKLFSLLFKQAYRSYADRKLDDPLSETESKLFCIDIQEKTGLVIGYKSVKNYSIFITGGSKKENPSLATLDTLARYVLKAPFTTEHERKKTEDHYPYWHLYKKRKRSVFWSYRKILLPVGILGIIGIILWLARSSELAPSEISFQDDFIDVSQQALKARSWYLVSKNEDYWQKRGEEEGFLKLFTLEGDNWPDSSTTELNIPNLLVQSVDARCFNVETQINDFVPRERWHQAGIIILEDTTFTGNVMRLSLAFNDFFGGFEYPAEIIVQGITSRRTNNPEEFLHHQVFQLGVSPDHLIKNNLKFCRLRIEKRGNEFRFLLAAGSVQNSAYVEIGKHSFPIKTNYVGIFAIKGNVKNSGIVPVSFDSFRLQTLSCEE